MKPKNRCLFKPGLLFLAWLVFIASFVHAAPPPLEPLESGKQFFSLQLRDTDIKDVLRLLAGEFGLNVVMGEGVSGRITIDFKQVSLPEALNAILKSRGLGYIKEGAILRIETLQNLQAEKDRKAEQLKKAKELEQETAKAEQQKAEAERKKALAEKELLPMITKTMKIKYIATSLMADRDKTSATKNLQNFTSILEKMLSGRQRSNITVVAKTNTLVVTDIEKNVDQILKIAKSLDVATPQIRIEGRVVETNNRDQLALGIQWGGKYVARDLTVQGGGSDSGQSDTGRSGEDLSVNLPAGVGLGAGGAIDFTLGKLGSKILDINLSAMERDDRLKILSRPSILVMQNQQAEIHVGSEVPILKGFSTTTGGGNTSGSTLPTPEVEYRKIGIRLNITPQITSEDSIFMAISIEKSDKGDPWIIQGQPYDSIATKNAFTQVVVKNGETVVIGGLYTKKNQTIESGVPYLSKIPLLGWLFKYKSEDLRDEELIIFITPEIIYSGGDSEKLVSTAKKQPSVSGVNHD